MTLEKSIDKILKTWMFAGVAATLLCYSPKNNANMIPRYREVAEYCVKQEIESEQFIPECHEPVYNSINELGLLVEMIDKAKELNETKEKTLDSIVKQSSITKGPTEYAGKLKENENVEIYKSNGKLISEVEGLATHYKTADGWHTTATGAPFKDNQYTAAINERLGYEIPARLKITSIDTGKSVEVIANDHGPYEFDNEGKAIEVKGSVKGKEKYTPHNSRMIDLSLKSAKALGIVDLGVAKVRIEYIESIDPKKL